jgi:hypothetical protein
VSIISSRSVRNGHITQPDRFAYGFVPNELVAALRIASLCSYRMESHFKVIFSEYPASWKKGTFIEPTSKKTLAVYLNVHQTRLDGNFERNIFHVIGCSISPRQTIRFVS